MHDTLVVLRNEWRSFLCSDRGLFVVYAVMIVGWGFLMAAWRSYILFFAPFWLASFSVIIAATFANSVFVADRISGSLEILLTCGISRSGILYGKLAFIFLTTTVVGALCMGLASIIRYIMFAGMPGAQVIVGASGIAVYCAASFMTATSSAYFSVLLPNPRVLHFINLIMVMFLVFVHSAAALLWRVPLYVLAIALLLLGALFLRLAKKEFEGEKITKLIVL
jgi:ABC-type Na+ efflux pump permease subunit